MLTVASRIMHKSIEKLNNDTSKHFSKKLIESKKIDSNKKLIVPKSRSHVSQNTFKYFAF